VIPPKEEKKHLDAIEMKILSGIPELAYTEVGDTVQFYTLAFHKRYGIGAVITISKNVLQKTLTAYYWNQVVAPMKKESNRTVRLQ